MSLFCTGTEVCILGRLVKPREVPHECMEAARDQHYLGANKPSLNMEGFDTKGRDRVFLH